MATLALSALGGSIGGGLLPSIGILGQTLSGAALGRAAGGLVGNYIDQTLFAPSGQTRVLEGPRLADLNVIASSEGAPIPKIYGRARVAGQIIWATKFEEEIIKQTQTSGASGGKGGGGSPTPTSESIEYLYYANFAVALAEGETTRLGRVWANGKDLNLSDYNYRFYKGSENQDPDSLIEAKEGSNNAPAYRGLSYIVFERMPLALFGNRIPQINFEIFRSFDKFEKSINAVTLIPSAGEYVYENDEVIKDLGGGASEAVNTHTHQGGTDWDVSLNQLEADLPNVKNISLIVSWFGTDLRASQCQLRPAVDDQNKSIIGKIWSVAGETRQTAHVVSLDQGRPVYGGTPSDETVVSAITDLNVRGIKVAFNPFILMDIPSNNTLPDPYSSNPTQPIYPWRGRITIDPAPDQPGTNDKTTAAATEVSSFIGTSNIGDYSINGSSVVYTGPVEWTFRRMILHYAHLCKAAGGVDTFIIGSEMRGLSWVRSSEDEYPFVDALVQLAADVKTVLGVATKVTYAADWSEYFGHQPQDGSNDVYFHLDNLWSSSNIDAIGIDCYWPLSDWRDKNSHLDEDAGTSTIYELDYLKGNIGGGEGYDWYYASETDRQNQNRTSITDGSGKPWVFRYKDIKSWWENQHYNRPGGLEDTSNTLWIPQSKPIWLMEIGCPAVDKGSNQPNVFIDPKSSESASPYFSDGSRDDFIQRRYIQAFNNYFDPTDPDFIEDQNPTSTQYSGRMVDPERLYIYTWDARPYPAFPANTEVWGDGDNWLKGHWLTGRVGSTSLDALVRQVLTDYNFQDFDVSRLEGVVDGFVIDRIMSARDALQPLELAYSFDSFETNTYINFIHRGTTETDLELTLDDLVETSTSSSLFNVTRSQETELPRAAKITFIDSDTSYQRRALDSRYLHGSSKRVATADLPIVTSKQTVQTIADKWVQESWVAREHANFTLPPSLMSLEPTDIINFSNEGMTKKFRITEINDQNSRDIHALTIEPQLYGHKSSEAQLPENNLPQVYGPTKAEFYDFPLFTGNEIEHAGYIGASQLPWPGRVAFYRSPEDASYTINQVLRAPSQSGTITEDLLSGPLGRWDYSNKIKIKLQNGTVQSSGEISVLGGRNTVAIRHDNDIWEIIQFQNAELVAEQEYELSNLLRGQAGTDDAIRTIASTGATFVVIDEAIKQINMNVNEIGLAFNWRYGPSQYDIGHPSFQTKTVTFTARGLRPFSPVHVKGETSGNDLIISWIRRSRIGGDSWELSEIPLSEESENYQVDILNGATVVRTISTTQANCTYSEIDQITDWGSVQSSYIVRVYQISNIYGRGTYAEKEIFTS